MGIAFYSMEKGNEWLNEMLNRKQQMFNQTVCKQHEFVEVTLTTAPINYSKKYLQCKHCGKVLENQV